MKNTRIRVDVFFTMIFVGHLYLTVKYDELFLRYALWKENSPIIDNGDGSYGGVIPSTYAKEGSYQCWIFPYSSGANITFEDDISDDIKYILNRRITEIENDYEGIYLVTITPDSTRVIHVLRFVKTYFSRNSKIILPYKNNYTFIESEKQKQCGANRNSFTVVIKPGGKISMPAFRARVL